MAEIKIDRFNYCNVNMSSPNSCNSSSLNQQQTKNENQNDVKKEKTNEQNLNLNDNLKSYLIDKQLNDKLKDNNNLKANATNGSNFNLNQNLKTKLNGKTSTFYLKNDQDKIDKQQSNDEQQQIQNEKIDQFNDHFDQLDRKSSSNEQQTANNNNNFRMFNNFITNEDIGQLLKAFQDKAFRSGEYRSKDEKIQFMCLNLFNYDYKPDELMIINNMENDLSSSYPLKIIIPKTKAFPSIDTERLRNLILKAKYARARCRFPGKI